MLPIQNLLRRKVRTLFALLGIAVGISSVVSIVSVARGLRDQFYRIADQFGYDVIVQQRGVVTPLLSHVSERDRERVALLPGVRATSTLSIYLLRRADETKPQPITVLGLEPGSEIEKRFPIVRGRGLAATDRNALVLGELGAEQLGVGVGSKIETQDVVGSYEGVGIFRNPVRDVDLLAGQALMNTALLSRELS